ncbi:ZipA, C-terminal FtsZ-binding domain containing protein [Methylophilaceae bacterium]|jgi:FtsZ-interacting cell division protein ZipA
MSDLQIALIAIGALIILAVLILNWWQERRFHRQVQSQFTDIKSDALLPESAAQTPLDSEAHEDGLISEKDDTQSGLEDGVYDTADAQDADNFTINVAVKIDAEDAPAFDTLTVTADSEEPQPSQTIEEVAPSAPAEPKVSAGLPSMLLSKIDTTALLYLAKESTRLTLKESLQGLFDGLDKPFFIHALDKNQAWQVLDDDDTQTYQPVLRVACSLQLADRGGAVTRSTLSRFQLAVTELALKINADLEWQDIESIQLQASELDEFCIAVDKTVGFHLSHGENGAFSAAKLTALAEAQGLAANDAGCLQAFNPQSAKPSFIIFNTENQLTAFNAASDALIKSVIFQLDIPRVDECTLAFKQMVKVAKSLAVDLNANLLDANNRILNDQQIEQIFQQVDSIQDTMRLRGIEPGSEAALRLFS